MYLPLSINKCLLCTYSKQNAFEKNLRKQLVTRTRETRDPEEMGKIIEQFDKMALEDKGDLKKAKIRRDFLKIRKGRFLDALCKLTVK